MEFLGDRRATDDRAPLEHPHLESGAGEVRRAHQAVVATTDDQDIAVVVAHARIVAAPEPPPQRGAIPRNWSCRGRQPPARALDRRWRSEEHTSELQSLMRNSYAVFCLQKK